MKHYVRVDENNIVVKAFSDAFETPLDTDICINEDGGRHFEYSGEINPIIIKNENYLYKFEDGKIVRRIT